MKTKIQIITLIILAFLFTACQQTDPDIMPTNNDAEAENMAYTGEPTAVPNQEFQSYC